MNTDSRLLPLAFIPLSLGAIKPSGWLQDQLRVQAAGLTGNLEEIWADVGPNSGWLGGTGEGWERGPYYTDGLIPLAALLDDPVLKQKAAKWVEAYLNFQGEDGWIGPGRPDGKNRGFDAWPNMVVQKVLVQHHNATGDPRVIEVMTRYARWLETHLDEYPLFVWGERRWPEQVFCLHWLYERTGEDWLLDVARKVHDQGTDWRTHFADLPYKHPVKSSEQTLESHVVNNAMAVKASAVWHRQSGDPADAEAARQSIRALDEFHGQVTGIFTGDEHFGGKEPIRGTELCAVVEYMFSLEVLASILGDSAFGDRLERIAYNALPGTFSADFWTHQYDQLANQVMCKVSEDKPWETNGPDANIYGLEPHYGCCTANLHQGWPKLTSHLWMKSPDGGLAAIAYAPCEVSADIAGERVRLDVDTDYPFGDTIRIRVGTRRPVAFPIHLRIPAWCEAAEIRLAETPAQRAEAGSYVRLQREWKEGDTILLVLPMAIRIEERLRGSVSVLRGPLVYSLQIGEEWKPIKGTPPAADYEVYPTSPWNYGLRVDRANPEASFRVETGPIARQPFSQDRIPVVLKAQGRKLPQWGMRGIACEPVPQSPVASSEPLEELTLIPYGTANLRMSEFPILKD